MAVSTHRLTCKAELLWQKNINSSECHVDMTAFSFRNTVNKSGPGVKYQSFELCFTIEMKMTFFWYGETQREQ